MLNILLILLRFSPYILIFGAGFYLKGCMTDKLISDLKNQVIENQEKIIITERKLNDYNNNVVTQTFDFIKKNDEIFNSAYKFDFNGCTNVQTVQKCPTLKVPQVLLKKENVNQVISTEQNITDAYQSLKASINEN